jgi:hypothetical protein
MRVSLSGVTKNAATVINQLLAELRHRCSDMELGQLEYGIQPYDTVFMLLQISKHAAETAKGQHTIAEFADHCCLTPKPE